MSSGKPAREKGYVMSRKLLCVTENPRGKRQLVESLSTSGYDVDFATGRRDALSLTEQNSYDVALLDECVDRENGIEIFRDIHQRQEQLGGILCCQDPTVDRVDAAIAAGIHHVVARPVNPREVLALITGVAGESSRPFDQRFPSVSTGYMTETGLRKCERQLECEVCGRPTHWCHRTEQAFFCCEDCFRSYDRWQ
jgi:DNA-binding response OmpR family regulator